MSIKRLIYFFFRKYICSAIYKFILLYLCIELFDKLPNAFSAR